MGDVLSIYHLARNPKRPLVCLDEFTKQLVSDVVKPLSMEPGKPERYDNEYICCGSAAAFLVYAPLEGRREVRFGDNGRRTAVDYASVLKYIANEMFPDAEKIILVEDN